MMIEGTAQKFETLADQSCKLSIYYPREIKGKVLELEGETVISMSVSEYHALKEGYGGSMSDDMRKRLLEALGNVMTILREDLELVVDKIKADVEMKGD